MTAPSAGTAAEQSVVVARTVAEVEALRELWQAHTDHAASGGAPGARGGPDVDADLDYFLAVVRCDDAVVSPYVLVVPGTTRPLLVVARLVDRPFVLRAGYRRLGSLRARSLVVSFGGVLGADHPDDRRAVAAALAQVLHVGAADVVVAQKAEVGAGPAGPRRLVRPAAPAWQTELPDSWEELLAARSSKSRRQIRYDDGKLRRAHPDGLEVLRLDRPDHRDRLERDLPAVAAASYQRGLGVSVVDDPVQAALLETARERGWLRVWLLLVDGRPAAFWWGVVRGGVLSIGSPGFVPELARERVGYYALRRMLEDACADPDIRWVDWGPGAADYKERFGTERREVADVLLFGRGPRATLLRAALRSQDAATAAARRGLERAGVAQDLRRRWRGRLAAPAAPPAQPASGDAGGGGPRGRT